jgi:hypothetical protein
MAICYLTIVAKCNAIGVTEVTSYCLTCAADAKVGSAGAAVDSVEEGALGRRVAGAQGLAVGGRADVVVELNYLEDAEY